MAQRRMRTAALLAVGLATMGLGGGTQSAPASTTPTVSVGSGSVVDGNSGTLSIKVPVTLSDPSSTTVTVTYAVVGMTATAGVDFKAKTGTLSFVPSGSAHITPVEKYVTVSVLADPMLAGVETFSVTLSNPTGGYALGNSVGTGTIFDEASPAGTLVNIGDMSVYQGFTGVAHVVNVPVTLSAQAGSTVQASWAITGGTALAGIDYTAAASGTLTFSPGKRALAIKVSVLPVNATHVDKTIQFTLSNPSGAVLGRSGGVVTLPTQPPVVTAVTADSGSSEGGTAVTVAGSHFTGATSVQFGSVSVGFSVASDGEIQTTAPPGSGTVDVTVTTPAGTSPAVVADRFLYTFTQAIGVPSYFLPGQPWTTMIAGAPTVGAAILNPDSGPGTAPDAGYQSEVAAAHQAGVAVYAYVATGNGRRRITDVEAEVAEYFSWYGPYGLSGIFFDEADPSKCTTVATYYGALFSYVKQQNAAATVVLNAGTQVPECFMAVSDVLVDFESSYSDYVNAYAGQSWETRYEPQRFWHIVHDVPSVAAVSTADALSRSRGAGTVYFTDEQLVPTSSTCPGGGTYLYDRLPCDTYWTAQLQAVAANETIGVPSSGF